MQINSIFYSFITKNKHSCFITTSDVNVLYTGFTILSSLGDLHKLYEKNLSVIFRASVNIFLLSCIFYDND